MQEAIRECSIACNEPRQWRLFDAVSNSLSAVKASPSKKRKGGSGRSMAFRVEVAPQAFADLNAISKYIKDRTSFEMSELWFNGIIDAMRTLRARTNRLPVAL